MKVTLKLKVSRLQCEIRVKPSACQHLNGKMLTDRCSETRSAYTDAWEKARLRQWK